MWQTMPVTSRRWNLLALLKDTFTTAEALDAGRQLMVTERTVMNYLKELAKTGSSTRSGRESTIKYHIPP